MTKTALVMDQSTAIADTLARELEAAGHVVVRAGYGDEVDATVEVIVTDNSQSVLARACLARPVVALYATEDAHLECLEAGAIWGVPIDMYPGISLTQGLCSVEAAVRVHYLVSTNRQLGSILFGMRTPAGAFKSLMEGIGPKR